MSSSGDVTSAGAPRVVGEAMDAARAIAGRTPQGWERLKGGKSDVFRLTYGPGHPDVVAKCAGSETIRVESAVLEWLELAPFPTVHSFGIVPAGTPGRTWLLSTYADGEPYDPRRPDHQDHAGAWLADLHHWTGPASGRAPELPGRGVDYHRAVMTDACSTLEDALGDGPFLTADEVGSMRRLARIGRLLLDRWELVGDVLAELPEALVHSGIAGKNVRISRGAVLAFDWEQAGRGCPAADVSAVGLDAYERTRARLGAGGRRVGEAAAIGTVLWCFAGIPGERVNLLGRWPHRAAAKMPHYLDRIEARVPDVLAEVLG